jgi:hypothetical protein
MFIWTLFGIHDIPMQLWVSRDLDKQGNKLKYHKLISVSYPAAVLYGSHSAHLIFHIIISELQCIILDSSQKKKSWHKKNYLGAKNIYWVHLFIGLHLFIPGMFIDSTFHQL